MKRLVKKAFGTTLYHGTTLEKLQGITEMGMIMPQERDGGGLNGDTNANIRYRVKQRLTNENVTDQVEYDEKYEQYIQEETAKENAKLEGYTFFADDMERAAKYCPTFPEIIIEVSLPEDSLLPDDNDCPECATWQESLSKINQVKVPGTITEDYIVGVYIMDSDYNEEFYPKLTWINEYDGR